jgi:hypothetical protein
VVSVTQPAGYNVPTSGTQLTASVTNPQVTLLGSGGTTIGSNLQVSASGQLNIPAPAGGLPVTITSSDPTKVLLANNPTDPGSSNITVTVPAGSGVNSIGFPTYYVQALGATSGSVTLTATAPGFMGSTLTLNLAPSGFVLSGNGQGVGQPVGVFLSLGQTVGFTAIAAVLDPATLAPTATFQAVRGGSSATVFLTSSGAQGTLTGSPITVPAGSSSAGGAVFTPQAQGTATVTITSPVAGFSSPSSGTSVSVLVN